MTEAAIIVHESIDDMREALVLVDHGGERLDPSLMTKCGDEAITVPDPYNWLTQAWNVSRDPWYINCPKCRGVKKRSRRLN